MNRKREKDGGRVQCFMKMGDTSLIDVDNRNFFFQQHSAFFAALASLVLQCCHIHLIIAAFEFCVT